MSTKDSVQLIS